MYSPLSDLDRTGFTERLWYHSHPLSLLLAPLGICYGYVALLRRVAYQIGLLPRYTSSLPVIVVGNLTVGGTGKTPFVIWLARYLKERGYRPGILSRGYGVHIPASPKWVDKKGSYEQFGDEPLLLAQHTDCPVVLSPKRSLSAKMLEQESECNIILCDDGLQHFGLARDIEIVLVDVIRGFGNRRCLPAGPLREPLGRLRSVDIVVHNGDVSSDHGYGMGSLYGDPVSLLDPGKILALDDLKHQEVHAVAGVGNPERFFSYLRSQQIQVIEHIYPDHHHYQPEDICFGDTRSVIMTEKDAIKCKVFATGVHWFLPMTVQLPVSFCHHLDKCLEDIKHG